MRSGQGQGQGQVEEGAPALGRVGGASGRRTFGNIVVSIVGSGVLGLPYTFRVSGWASASLCLAIAATLTYYCMMLLVKCRTKVEEEGHHQILTYGDLGKHAYGGTVQNLVELLILISQSGCCVAYLIFIGQNLSSLVTGGTSEQALYIFVLVPFQVGLGWVRSLAGLAPLSIFADACNVVAMGVVLRDDWQRLGVEGGIVAARGWEVVPFGLGVALYCYEGFGMTLTLEGSMERPQDFGRVLGHAFLLITILYVAFGLVGYLAFGDDTRDIITLNLPNDWSTALVKAGLCVALFFTFPVMMYPVHEIVESKLLRCGYFQTRIVPHHPCLLKFLLDSLRGVIILIVALVAVSVPGFGVFISLVGSTVCSMLAFVFPALFHLHVFKDCMSYLQWTIDLFLLLAGLAFALYGTYSTFVELFGQQ